MKGELALVLYNLRSVHNVGSIFRTADGLGVSKIVLVGTTPTPLDRFGRKRSDIAKVALGAEETVPYEYFEDWEDAKAVLEKEGYTLGALEQDKKSVPLGTKVAEDRLALVVGPEVTGLPIEVLGDMQYIFEIPMKGQKESLNVAVATGIAVHSLLEQ